MKTNDQIIREELREALISELHEEQTRTGHPARLFSEFGVNHGLIRADIVTVNGILHGYEIKSDVDSLYRLPRQSVAYNKVFDKVTLVVGKKHVIDAISIIPDWWGVKLAKANPSGKVVLTTIRPPENNPRQDSLSIAQLLWRQEAIDLLESNGNAQGIRSATRDIVYQRVATSLSQAELKKYVREKLFNRLDWRADQPLLQYDD